MLAKNSLFFSFILLLLLSGCRDNKSVHSFTFTGMGTVLTVTYAGKQNTTIENDVKKSVAQFENQVSYYRKESFVSQFNQLRKERYLSVPHWFCSLVFQSLSLGAQTGNAFDITYKVKGKLWDKKGDTPPTDRQLQQLNSLVGPDLVESDCQKNRLRKKKDGVIIDLGGVAKGYSIDRVGDELKQHGIANFIVNFGGDMLVCGSKNGKRWKIGIKNPLKQRDFLKVIMVSKEHCVAMATSGDYERFVVKKGKKYSHILNPQTGRPIENAKSVTVVGKSATVVDLLATAISVKVENQHFIKKIVASFGVAVYTLSGVPIQWRTFEPTKRASTQTEGR